MSNFNICKSNTVLIIVIVAASLTEVITLHQAEVLVNESTFNISCVSKKVESIQWHHTPPGKKINEYVYAGGEFQSSYRDGRFRVDNDLTMNMYTLVISNVTREDAGLYECKDDVLSGVFGSTHLTVLDSSPVCTSNMNPHGFVGPNTCKIEEEIMTFSCAVSFSGNSPNLMWSTFNGNEALNSSICESKDNRVNCSLSMKADPSFDGSTFICQTTASTDARHKCSIKNRVEYFLVDYETVEKKVGDNATCKVASNLHINYNWTLQQNNQDKVFSANRTIYFQEPGIYKCRVKYNIRDVTCYAPIAAVIAGNIVHDKETAAESSHFSSRDKSIAIAVGASILLILVAAIAFVIYRYRKRFMDHMPGRQAVLGVSDDITSRNNELHHLLTKDEPSISSKIEAQREKLQDIIAPGFGLTAKLSSSNVLTSDEESLIDAKETTDDKNKLLLDLILKSGKCEELVRALRESDQIHVANWIVGNGVHRPQFGLDWPLGENEFEFLRINLENLIKVLDRENGFLGWLHSMKVINGRQMESIEGKSTPERNEAFLEFLKQSSRKAYNLATIWLRISKLFESHEGKQKNGLAYSYFFGYLQMVIPGFRKSFETKMQNSSAAKEPTEKKFLVKKMLIIISKTLRAPKKLTEYINFSSTKIVIKKCSDRAGKERREYNIPIYELTDKKSGNVYYFATDIPACLYAIREAYERQIMSIGDVNETRDDFVRTLETVLNDPRNGLDFANECELLVWPDDEKEDNRMELSEFVCQQIENKELAVKLADIL